MGVQYLVDYENVHETGIIGLEELSPEDNVYIFHTNMTEKIRLSILDYVQAWVKVILVPPGNQSLDMHLGSFLGYLIGKEENPETQYAIVSHAQPALPALWHKNRSKILSKSNQIHRAVKTNIFIHNMQNIDSKKKLDYPALKRKFIDSAYKVHILAKKRLFLGSEIDPKTATKKPRKPLKQRPSEFMELIARFELATSSLPRMRSTD